MNTTNRTQNRNNEYTVTALMLSGKLPRHQAESIRNPIYSVINNVYSKTTRNSVLGSVVGILSDIFVSQIGSENGGIGYIGIMETQVNSYFHTSLMWGKIDWCFE